MRIRDLPIEARKVRMAEVKEEARKARNRTPQCVKEREKIFRHLAKEIDKGNKITFKEGPK